VHVLSHVRELALWRFMVCHCHCDRAKFMPDPSVKVPCCVTRCEADFGEGPASELRRSSRIRPLHFDLLMHTQAPIAGKICRKRQHMQESPARHNIPLAAHMQNNPAHWHHSSAQAKTLSRGTKAQHMQRDTGQAGEPCTCRKAQA
jgi:hypothetical protein